MFQELAALPARSLVQQAIYIYIHKLFLSMLRFERPFSQEASLIHFSYWNRSKSILAGTSTCSWRTIKSLAGNLQHELLMLVFELFTNGALGGDTIVYKFPFKCPAQMLLPGGLFGSCLPLCGFSAVRWVEARGDRHHKPQDRSTQLQFVSITRKMSVSFCSAF